MTGEQSALRAAGSNAVEIESLWWVFFAVCVAVEVAVVIALLAAIFHRRRVAGLSDGHLPVEQKRRITAVVVAATLATVTILVGLLFASVSTGRSIAANPSPDALAVEITGHRWWWQITYDHPIPAKRVTTANELHIPVGREIDVRLFSSDVIHSIWVPSLSGKQDLIPGLPTRLRLKALRPGVFRGQCAEFCGAQHANMGILVVAEEPSKFETWLEAQRLEAPKPRGEVEARGQEVFLTGPCALCHAVAGTPASATVGPDLTHVASRDTLAAGTIPNTREQMAKWITDPQSVKPGANMPAIVLPPDDLQALVTWLETLR